MQEGVAKTGVYDIFNDFPYTTPDAAGAKVIIPLDDYAAKYKPDFSGVADGLKFQQYYDGKLYIMVNDGDHLILALRKDLVENPQARAEYKAKFDKDLGCPDTVAGVGAAVRVLPDQGRRHALGRQVREAALRRARLPLDQLLLPALPGLHEGPPVRQGHEAAHQHAGRHRRDQGVRRQRRAHAQGHPGLGHAADLSVLGERPGLFGDVVPLDRRVRRRQSEQRDQGQADHLPHPGPDDRRQARAPRAAGRRHRLHGERLFEAPGARLPVHPVVHQPEHRRRGGRASEGLLGSVSRRAR